MDIQKILSYLILLVGIIYFILFSVQIIKEKKNNNFKFKKYLLVIESIIYFLSTLGISDFLMNTIAIKKFNITEDRNIAHSLIATTIVPSSILCFLFLKKSEAIDTKILLIYIICILVGAFIGSNLSSKVDTKIAKKIMAILLIISIIAIIIKLILSGKETTYVDTISGIKLIILIVVSLFMGIFNMFGIPMKPIAASLFLLLGMSPIVTLTMLMVIGITNFIGGINVLKENRYDKSMVISSFSLGVIFAILGVIFAISINQLVLNIIIIIVILIAIYSLLKK